MLIDLKMMSFYQELHTTLVVFKEEFTRVVVMAVVAVQGIHTNNVM